MPYLAGVFCGHVTTNVSIKVPFPLSPGSSKCNRSKLLNMNKFGTKSENDLDKRYSNNFTYPYTHLVDCINFLYGIQG